MISWPNWWGVAAIVVWFWIGVWVGRRFFPRAPPKMMSEEEMQAIHDSTEEPYEK